MNNLKEIRFATTKDRAKIMSFIKINYMYNHILAQDIKFFNYQYTYGDNLQFILIEDFNDKIIGILGYIQYNPQSDEQDIFLALMKVIPKQSDDLISIKLIQYLSNNIKHRHIFCVGINMKTCGIYKLLRYQLGKLDHFVSFNQDLKNYIISDPPTSLGKIENNCKFKIKNNNDIEKILTKLKDTEFYYKTVPFKSLKYISHRYKDHPYYSYIFYEVFNNSLFIGFAVLREVKYKKSQAIRIIDVIAADENIAFIINDLATILVNSYYEYIDVYASCLNNKVLLSGNYKMVSNENDMIVPDHFSPYVKTNIDILFTTSNTSKTILFKGDGDQDQPRLTNT